MRHRKSGKKLGRTWEHRKAMFRNMARSLITYGRIKTTAPKAKELSKVVDKLVTLAKKNDLSSRRQAYKVLENHSLVQKLFNEIGPKLSQSKGGYTRVVKFATPRVGDSAAMAMIELTYFEADAKEITGASAAQSTPTVAASSASTESETVDPEASQALTESEKAVSEVDLPEDTSVHSPEDNVDEVEEPKDADLSEEAPSELKKEK
ncbi:MAG: 50S ribosomal protein L17 [Desulfonatronovibrio sp.]